MERSGRSGLIWRVPGDHWRDICAVRKMKRVEYGRPLRSMRERECRKRLFLLKKFGPGRARLSFQSVIDLGDAMAELAERLLQIQSLFLELADAGFKFAARHDHLRGVAVFKVIHLGDVFHLRHAETQTPPPQYDDEAGA